MSRRPRLTCLHAIDGLIGALGLVSFGHDRGDTIKSQPPVTNPVFKGVLTNEQHALLIPDMITDSRLVAK